MIIILEIYIFNRIIFFCYFHWFECNYTKEKTLNQHTNEEASLDQKIVSNPSFGNLFISNTKLVEKIPSISCC